MSFNFISDSFSESASSNEQFIKTEPDLSTIESLTELSDDFTNLLLPSNGPSNQNALDVRAQPKFLQPSSLSEPEKDRANLERLTEPFKSKSVATNRENRSDVKNQGRIKDIAKEADRELDNAEQSLDAAKDSGEAFVDSLGDLDKSDQDYIEEKFNDIEESRQNILDSKKKIVEIETSDQYSEQEKSDLISDLEEDVAEEQERFDTAMEDLTNHVNSDGVTLSSDSQELLEIFYDDISTVIEFENLADILWQEYLFFTYSIDGGEFDFSGGALESNQIDDSKNKDKKDKEL